MKRREPTSDIPPVGSKVRMRFALLEVIATVIEHRGPLGREGRQLIRVRFELEGADEPIETELPVDEVTVALPPDAAEPVSS